jgi:hypothetical protein
MKCAGAFARLNARRAWNTVKLSLGAAGAIHLAAGAPSNTRVCCASAAALTTNHINEAATVVCDFTR